MAVCGDEGRQKLQKRLRWPVSSSSSRALITRITDLSHIQSNLCNRKKFCQWIKTAPSLDRFPYQYSWNYEICQQKGKAVREVACLSMSIPVCLSVCAFVPVCFSGRVYNIWVFKLYVSRFALCVVSFFPHLLFTLIFAHSYSFLWWCVQSYTAMVQGSDSTAMRTDQQLQSKCRRGGTGVGAEGFFLSGSGVFRLRRRDNWPDNVQRPVLDTYWSV